MLSNCQKVVPTIPYPFLLWHVYEHLLYVKSIYIILSLVLKTTSRNFYTLDSYVMYTNVTVMVYHLGILKTTEDKLYCFHHFALLVSSNAHLFECQINLNCTLLLTFEKSNDLMAIVP